MQRIKPRKSVICLSTDKAAYPVNAMGTSKAMMEKVMVAKSRTVSPEKTKICGTRYGNVLCSRVLLSRQIKAGKSITITDPLMTRFIMSLEDSVDLGALAEATKELFDRDNRSKIKVIGIRHGEKIYETLLTNEECANALDLGNFYRVP